MQIYKAPLDDFRFCMETFGYDAVHKLPGYGDYDIETVFEIFKAGDTFAREKLLPLNRTGDQEGLKFDQKTGEVTLPQGFDALYKEWCEAGYPSFCHEAEHGGAGAPQLLAVVFNEMFCATNKAFTMISGLSHGLIESLIHHGSDVQKEIYLAKLISGEWTGTMCLTEPQAGTDLGLVSTKATPQDDGTFKLTGTKIWITFGEHSLSENIIHLVLARTPDAPEGIKGISVFLVPKINEDGSKNAITCGGLEHKMGIHASPTCVMNMDDATGHMVGAPNTGMKTMFVMMNAARLFVGVEGLALSEISYQTALAFAKDRRQMKAMDPAKHEEGAKADTIMVHPDIRRQLLNIKSTNEGMRAMGIWVGCLLDQSLKAEDDAVRAHADDMVALLTPICKSFCTERGFRNINDAMQICGGAGYTTDWSIEQYFRDERIALIYEGTNHVQALDLVGRKLPKDGGRLYKSFSKEIFKFVKANSDNADFAEFGEPIQKALDTLNEVTMALAMKGMQDPEEAGAAASNYLNLFAYTTLAYMWGRMAKASLDAGGKGFHGTKLKTARYYFKHVLPEMDSLLAMVNAGKAEMIAFDVDEF